jgi:hypothetical protein
MAITGIDFFLGFEASYHRRFFPKATRTPADKIDCSVDTITTTTSPPISHNSRQRAIRHHSSLRPIFVFEL